MRPANPTPPPVVDDGYVDRLAALARQHGITHSGVAPAEVMHRARAAIRQRISDGLVAGMQFTFKNPERSTDPGAAVAGARAVFVGALPYLLEEPAPGAPSSAEDDAPASSPLGRIARYAWRDHYAPLRAGLADVAALLRADGFKAVAFADDNSIVDREAAYRAGIGWFGKNANLLVPGAGSWFVLGCVVTTAPLPVATAPVAEGCGSCTRCISACPTAAIVAPGVIDAERCLAWVMQRPGIVPRSLRAAVGDRMYGCDDCQEACPPSVRHGLRHPPPPSDEPLRRAVDVVGLLSLDDAALEREWGRWYLADRDPRWVRRNALVVLGNPPTDESTATAARAAAAVAAHVGHPDPVLRIHAIWAAWRRGLLHLVPAGDPHPDVAAELVALAAERPGRANMGGT
ncbi:MAG: tRNA epoxyqueuosine(34) reductase QueG [Ilumatobacteraceae bacterium]